MHQQQQISELAGRSRNPAAAEPRAQPGEGALLMLFIPIFLLLHLVFTTAVLLSIATVHSQDPTSDLLSHLESLQSQSSSTNGGGVIHLTDPLLKRILSLPNPRPFSFVIFFDAKQLHSKAELSLPALKSEFALVSKSYLSNNPSDFHSKLFFFDLEFQESQSSFALFAVNSLPHIKLVPNSAAECEERFHSNGTLSGAEGKMRTRTERGRRGGEEENKEEMEDGQ